MVPKAPCYLFGQKISKAVSTVADCTAHRSQKPPLFSATPLKRGFLLQIFLSHFIVFQGGRCTDSHPGYGVPPRWMLPRDQLQQHHSVAVHVTPRRGRPRKSRFR